ncbi:DUF6082 family protein [Streptomyces sp. NPDC058045]|uniref:DUF6082 family protein n=1 Tax=Streptomyces sp. NPDC058045 TaxID=3346311 RepID=UPI0036ED3E6F
MNQMKPAHALLALAVAGLGAHLWQRERHQRETKALTAASMHAEYLRYIESHPELLKQWAPEDDSLTPEEYSRRVHANHLFVGLAARHRARILDNQTLRTQAQWLMSRQIGRDYWESFGAWREGEARDKWDRRFNAIMSDEYAARPEVTTAGAA